MSHRGIPILFLILVALALGACLGELQLPTPEAIPPPLLMPPPADPTVASSPRLSLDLADQPMVSSLTIPPVRHDLIGRSDCLMCHKQGVSDAPRVPDAHRGLESTTCMNCHPAPARLELSSPELYLRLCSRCHGENGEGAFGPALNVKSFLRDISDNDLREAIVRGRGASEMLSWGDLGLLTDPQIDELVAMIRAWEPTAPETSGAIAAVTVSAARGDPEEGSTLFAQFCSGCHGPSGETEVGDEFLLQEAVGPLDDASLARQIRGGSEQMPPFHALLTTDDLNDLLAFMRSGFSGTGVGTTPSFSADVLPILTEECALCHGTAGGWSAATYDDVVNSGENAPAVIPGDPEMSPLVHRLRGTQTIGGPMPPAGSLSDEVIDLIIRWIAAGAPNN